MSEKEMTLSEAACIVLTMAERYLARSDDAGPDGVNAAEVLANYLENEDVDIGGIGVTREELNGG